MFPGGSHRGRWRHEAAEPENAPDVVEAARRCVEQSSDVSLRARAAKHIQKRWRQYREAVAELEMLDDDDCATTTLSLHSFPSQSSTGRRREYAAAECTIRGQAAATRSSSTSTSSLEAAEDGSSSLGREHRRSRRSSLARHSADNDDDDDGLGSIILSILTTAGGEYSTDDDDVARDEIIREYAATVIQRRVRRSLLRSHQIPFDGDGRTGSVAVTVNGSDHHHTHRHHQLSGAVQSPGGPIAIVGRASGSDATIPDSAVNALRILQNRFRFQRFRRMIEERERNELIRRVQQLWRRRKDLKRHFEALRSGREDAAARGIQRAYLQHARGVTSARPSDGGAVGCRHAVSHAAGVAVGPGPAAARPSPAPPVSAAFGLPTCIICMVQTVQIAFLPCGHAHACVGCGAQCQRCPTCRKMIALQLRIYL